MNRMIRGARRAFTLIELLVAMSIIVVLTSLVLLVVTNINERDGTTDAAGLTRQWLMIAKARAGRDNAPRGIRLVSGLDPSNPAKTSPFWVTELQYIEAPPILITYPALNGDQVPTGVQLDPAVNFIYTLSPGPPANPTTPGTLINRQCQIVNLKFDDAGQLLVPGSTTVILPRMLLQLPVLGSWHRITGGTLSPALNAGNPGPYIASVQLDSFPDSQVGAGGMTLPLPQPAAGPTPACYTTQHFGISAPPRPLLGEPPLQLPKNICIDVSPSTIPTGPSPPAPGPNYLAPPSSPLQGVINQDLDILFTANGQVMPIGAGAAADGIIFLWHRDYTKLKNAPNGNNALVITNAIWTAPFPPPIYDMFPFQNGGEQQIVAIRCKTGSLGQFPVLWPNAGGQYAPGDDPYTLARLGATSP